MRETKQILLKIPVELERKIEEAYLKGNYRSRQEFILAAVRKSVNRERL
jgi:Arc/MetJ-type ribon-helix-helix transcriptional regulator